MGLDTNDGIKIYDYFEFPNREQRDKAKEIFDIAKLNLKRLPPQNIVLQGVFFEKYNAWSAHISNFSIHLGIHFLLQSLPVRSC